MTAKETIRQLRRTREIAFHADAQSLSAYETGSWSPIARIDRVNRGYWVTHLKNPNLPKLRFSSLKQAEAVVRHAYGTWPFGDEPVAESSAKAFILGQKIPAPKLRWRHAPLQTFQNAYWKSEKESEGYVHYTSSGWRALLWMTEVERGKHYATAAEARAAVQQAWEEEWALNGPPLSEGIAKDFVRKVRPTIQRTTFFRSVPEGAWFKDNQGFLCQKRQGLWWAIPNNPDAHAVGHSANPGYRCFPASWSMAMIRAAQRHYRQHPHQPAPAGWAVIEGSAKAFLKQLPQPRLPARFVIRLHAILYDLRQIAQRLQALSPRSSIDERDAAVAGLSTAHENLWALGHTFRAYTPRLDQHILDTLDTETDRLVILLNQDCAARPEDGDVLYLAAQNLEKLL